MTLTPDQPQFARGPLPTHLARTLIADAVRLVSLDVLNFAMAHNSVPLVRELAITNRSNETWTRVAVSVELQGFAEPWLGNIETLERGHLSLRRSAAALRRGRPAQRHRTRSNHADRARRNNGHWPEPIAR